MSEASRPRILVVEDDQNVLRALRDMLSQSGFDAVACALGHDALHAAQTSPKPFSAALVDIHLPDLNGLVLCQQLRQIWGAAVPILVLSADSSMETLKTLPLVGADYFLSKPVNADHLIDQLRQRTEASRGTQTTPAQD